MEKKILLLLICLLVGSGIKAQSNRDNKVPLEESSVELIPSKDLMGKISNNENLVILDTRTPEEYQVSHIPGAIFINYDNFESSDVKQVDPNAEIVVYCTIGYRSGKLGERLLDLGFTHVKNLDGGIIQWANEQGPLLNKMNQPTDSVHTYSWLFSGRLKRGVKVY